MKKLLIIYLLFNIAEYAYGMQGVKQKSTLNKLALFGTRAFCLSANDSVSLPLLLKNLKNLKDPLAIKNALLEKKYSNLSLVLNKSLDETKELVNDFKAKQRKFFAYEFS